MMSSAQSRISGEEVLALLEAEEEDVEEDVDEVFFPGSDKELGFHEEEEEDMSEDNEEGLAFQYICSLSQLVDINTHIYFTDKEEEPTAEVNISSMRTVSISDIYAD